MTAITEWLSSLGLEKYGSAFAEAEIEIGDLPSLSEDDLKELGLPLGPRRRVNAAIMRLRGDADSVAPPSLREPAERAVSDAVPPAHASDAERRHLTVMFIDLVGSTEMATKIDPEDMRDVITGFQNTVAGVVGRFEGFVAKFMGDGALCYFGWPRANEDDAERAVRAGLSIIEAVRKTKGPDGAPLATRVGIATGVVIVGDLIGSGATQEAAVVGETPNLAARLQGIARPDQLVLPRTTQALLGDIFRMNSIGAHKLKGIAAPVEAFVVTGETTRESRFAARQIGALTPIVGREREINLIMERWALARSSRGQMVVVSGEAGIGKSRIAQAAIGLIAEDDHTRITIQCSPYHADSAFYPVIQHMSFAAGIAPTDGPDARLDKLETLLDTDRHTLNLVAALLGLDGTQRYGALKLTPAQQRTQTMQALAKLVVHQARERPVLMVYEDLHWIDPTSLEVLDLMLDAIADQRIMILGTARPTFDYGFGGHPIVARFALNRLGKDQIGAIVSKLTGGKALPDEINQIIAARTDGVPLFVEELTKTILESGALREEGDRFVLNGLLSAIPIPTTLHDSLMARLDRLQPIKEVAQTAACIGREFDHGLLAKISHLPDAELTAALQGLIKAELVYRRGLPPDATYLFKHALVRDAAYESLLKEKRRAVHTRILTALETDADVAPEVLAVHAEAADLTERAIDLWEAASKAAIARPAFDEAISHLGHAIALILPQLQNGDSPPYERALSLQVPLGMALLTRKGYGADETIAAFEHALVLADKVGETPLRYPILYGLWIGMGIRGRHAEAWPRAKALLEQAVKSPGTAPIAVANRVAAASRWLMGDIGGADRYLNAALEQFDPIAHAGLADRFGQDIGVAIHVFTAANAMTSGQTRRAWTHLDEAASLARSAGHVPTICYMLLLRAIVSLMDRNLAEAERCVTEVMPIAQEHNLAGWIGYSALAREALSARMGDKSSIRRYRTADARLVSENTRMFVPHFRIEASWGALAMGLQDEAAELAAMAQGLIDQTGETYCLSDLHRLQAALATAAGDGAAAERYLNAALEVARRQGARLWELRAAIDLARIWKGQGGISRAVELLRPVHDDVEEGDRPDDRAAAGDLLAELASEATGTR